MTETCEIELQACRENKDKTTRIKPKRRHARTRHMVSISPTPEKAPYGSQRSPRISMDYCRRREHVGRDAVPKTAEADISVRIMNGKDPRPSHTVE